MDPLSRMGGNSMRILVISHMYPNVMHEVYGIFVAHQVSELVKLGHEVKVVSPVPWSPGLLRIFKEKWGKYAQIPRREERQGVEVFYPRYLVLPRKYLYRYLGWFCYWGIKKTVKKIFAQFPFDVIHAHTALPDGYAAVLLKKHLSRPVALTIHGQDIFSNIWIDAACRKAVSRTLNAADSVVAVSSLLKEKMADLMPLEKIDVIPNGILWEEMAPDYSYFPEEFRGKRILLSVGYLIERKGHRYVLEALAHLVKDFPDLLYVIIGDGLEEEGLKKMVTDLSLEDYVRFLGRRSGAEVMNYMALSEIFVLPSWNEAFGVVYIEAMAQGKPVIGCRGEGIEDFVTDGVNGILVPPRNSQELARALAHLLAHREKAEEIGSRGKETVMARYTWTQVARELESLYRRLLG